MYATVPMQQNSHVIIWLLLKGHDQRPLRSQLPTRHLKVTAEPKVLGSHHGYIYTIGRDGHSANIEVAECADDKEVVEKALAQANGCAIEIWDHKRFVVRLPGDAPKRQVGEDAPWQSIG